MPLVTDEQTVKPESDYVKLEKENTVTLLSNVYHLTSHYLKDKKKSVICKGKECAYCALKIPPRREYYYFADVNGARGLLRLPAGVFFSMNQLEKVMKNNKSKRDWTWTVLKEGEGLETKYTCSKDEPIKEPEDTTANNKYLEEKIGAYENRLNENYDLFKGTQTENAPAKDEAGKDLPF